MLPAPSEEQSAIVKKVFNGTNIIVDAVAGSGKTTTILHIAKSQPHSRILLVTYNKRLKDETRQRVIDCGINNLEVHSYHALCVKYYNTAGSRDHGVLATIVQNMPPRRPLQFNIFILDEVQDMKPLYFNFIVKAINDNTQPPEFIPMGDDDYDDFDEPDDSVELNQEDAEFYMNLEPVIDNEDEVISSDESDMTDRQKYTNANEEDSQDIIEEINSIQEQGPNNTQICVFGDIRQNIYAFQSSDDRYLSMADVMFDKLIPGERKWEHMKLQTSFRITNQIAEFINNCCLKENRLVAQKHGSKPIYLICNAFGNAIFKEVKSYIDAGYGSSDIFIIGPTIRKRTGPMRNLENNLVQAGYPCYVPISDDAKLDPQDIDGKIVFSTIHQVKGLERKIVVLFNFDDTYFTYYNKDADPNVCPNEIYVAMTRAKEYLILVHHNRNAYMPFLETEKLQYAKVSKIGRFNPKSSTKGSHTEMSVLDVVRHIKLETITKISELIKWEKIQLIPAKLLQPECIKIPTTVDGTIGTENVADINGTCLPALYELYHTGRVSIIDYVYDNSGKLSREHKTKFKNLYKKYKLKQMKTSDFLYVSNLFQSLRSGYQFKIEQISNYNWLPSTEVSKSLKLLKKYVSPAAKFESSIFGSMEVYGIRRNIYGCIDAIDHESPLSDTATIWEFKCVENLGIDHILQLSIYAWLLQQKDKHDNKHKKYKFYLLNILKEELIEISPTSKFEEAIMIILKEKLKPVSRVSDVEFINGAGVIA